MKKFIICLFLLVLISKVGYSQRLDFDSTAYFQALEKTWNDSVNASFNYQYGTILLEDGIAEFDVPEGFKFLDAKQATIVMTELWKNPPSQCSGLLLKQGENPVGNEPFSYAIEIDYNKSGYISDEDANSIDYDDLLEDMKKSTEESNIERKKNGYDDLHLVGWAYPPYYNQDDKILYWAKEFKFSALETNVLNMNMIFLGRKGYFTFNFISDIGGLQKILAEKDQLISGLKFTQGNRYSDFDSNVDAIAAVGIGGLIAGKVISSKGFLVLLAKSWKLIALAIVGIGGVLGKIFSGSRNE
jgi:uncharacterized membrane-anchored protein